MNDTIERLWAALVEHREGRAWRSARCTLAGNRRPWQGTGLRLAQGQAYSILADGRVHWSERHPHLHGGPGFHLYARVSPDGRLVNVTRTSGSFVADVAGELELGIYLGMWRDDYGGLDTPDSAYARLRGDIDVVVLAWPGAAVRGLATLAAELDDPLLQVEAARAAAPVAPPRGWDYLVETGTSDIWQACDEQAPRICLHAVDDQGIIRKPLDFELQPGTQLQWRWRLDEHPSGAPEDSRLAHDYVSIALEFDDGRDLTWLWSSCLPVETWFACPVKAWSARETHYVVRSGLQRRGTWVSEQRDVHADVARALGTVPCRIVACWLIAVASFQHGTARAAFEDIVLAAGTTRQVVL
ncbi:MAG: DUF3047 domain-containing protein [Gammaproteobacteria bacterium]|nr:DUF3047 domain-containing protein [Gammaproteobacteria bacterium]